MTELDLGPIDYLVLAFPGARLEGAGLQALLNLVDAGTIQVLDLRVAKVADDGTLTAVAITDLDGDGTLDLAVFQGVESGLIGDDDLAQSSGLVTGGDAVGILIYENTWARPFVTAMHQAGAELVSSGRIRAADIIEALDLLELSDSAS